MEIPTARTRRADAERKAAALREEARMEAQATHRRSRELTLALMASLKAVVALAGLHAPHRETVAGLLTQAERLLADAPQQSA